MYIRKGMGSRTEPCGTPAPTEWGLLCLPITDMSIVLSTRKSCIQESSWVSIPRDDNLVSRIGWETVSNVSEKSNKMRPTTLPSSPTNYFNLGKSMYQYLF